MAQFARPITDVTQVNWTEDDDTLVSLFDQINESVADDVNYLRTGAGPGGTAVYVAKLSPVTDPALSTGHIARYHYRKDATGGDTINLVVQLRQGYVSEGAQGTLIHAVTHSDIPGDAWTTGTFTLSGGEADAITDYASLYVRFVG